MSWLEESTAYCSVVYLLSISRRVVLSQGIGSATAMDTTSLSI